MLRGLQIQHFALLENLSIGLQAADLEAAEGGLASLKKYPQLRSMTAFIGRNSSGKSSLFGSLHFLAKTLLWGLPEASSRLHRQGFAALRQRGTDEPMSFSLLFEHPDQQFLAYEVRLSTDANARPRVSAERLRRYRYEPAQKCWQAELLLNVEEGEGVIRSLKLGEEAVRLVDRKQLALALYGHFLQYSELCYLYQQISHWYLCQMPGDLREMPTTAQEGGHKHINERCDNVEQVLTYWRRNRKEHYRQLMDEVGRAIPTVKRMDDLYLDREISSGNLRLFIYLLLLSDPRPLMCFDEPEQGLHHEMQEALMLKMRQYSLEQTTKQVFLATHSATVLDALRPEEVFVLKNDGRQVAATPADRDGLVRAFYDQGISLGTLWYGGHLGC